MERECTSTGPALTHPLHLDIYIYIFAYSQGDKLDSREQCKYIPTNPLATLPSWYLTLLPT
jgi:hypothetical protein